MNVFQRMQDKITKLFSSLIATRQDLKEAEKKNPAVAWRHMWRFRGTTGRPIFGPAFDVPRENHHLTRQTCRHYLRARFFAGVSQGSPELSRKDRRRMARLFACLEYRRQMQDDTNAIPDDERRLYERLDRMAAA